MRHVHRNFIAFLLTILATVLRAGAADAQVFRAYFIDVEGGQATLMISPSGQSLLIDTGWPGPRDADRIVASARSAGVKQIDYLWVSHYHLDHVGGVPDLAKRIPIVHFVDHGESRETNTPEGKRLYEDYVAVRAEGHHLVAKPGDRLPITGMEVEVVAAAGRHITAALPGLPGAGESNPYCQGVHPREPDPSENAQSLGLALQVGSFRLVDLGDLTWNKELELMCPVNRLGVADVYVASHHGLKQSGSPALVNALRARAAIIDNGSHKGGSPEAWKVIHHAPGLEDIWQIHYAVDAGDASNAPEKLLANPGKNDQDDRGFGIELVAKRDGSFALTNLGNGYSKTYAAKSRDKVQ